MFEMFSGYVNIIFLKVIPLKGCEYNISEKANPRGSGLSYKKDGEVVLILNYKL